MRRGIVINLLCVALTFSMTVPVLAYDEEVILSEESDIEEEIVISDEDVIEEEITDINEPVEEDLLIIPAIDDNKTDQIDIQSNSDYSAPAPIIRQEKDIAEDGNFCFTEDENGATSPVILQTDVSEASKNCTLLGLKGKYIVQIQDALDRINDIRKEACNEGVINPNTGRPLKPSDYVPIKWSSDLEYIARIRAAEAALTMDHVRTNGSRCFAISSPNGVCSYGEVIAWNFTETMVYGVNQWYGEKSAWVNNVSGAVTGHYEALIKPTNRYVGLGTFCSRNAKYYNTTAGEFCSISSGLDESRGSAVDSCIQLLEINNNSYLKNYKINNIDANMQIVKGSNIQLELTTGVRYTDYWEKILETNGLIIPGVSWKSSDSSKFSVSSEGIVIAKSCGAANITAFIDDVNADVISLELKHVDGELKNKKEATYDEAGYTGDVYCKYCGTVLTHGSVIPKKIKVGWQKDANGWWYQNADGSRKTNCWATIDGKKYRFGSNGYMQTGWVKISNKWYYLDSNGVMQKGWIKINGKKYYLSSKGVRKTGWVKIKSKWYYFNSKGVMKTGWVKLKGKWYYLNSKGVMQTGWVKIKGKRYYLYKDGHMAKNTWIGKYHVNASGVRDAKR